MPSASIMLGAGREGPIQGGTHLEVLPDSVGTWAVADVSVSRVVVLIGTYVVGVY